MEVRFDESHKKMNILVSVRGKVELGVYELIVRNILILFWNGKSFFYICIPLKKGLWRGA